jgi:predicted anti-sigma-YlaC factor YlaD
MDHETIQDMFSEYMEGELSGEKARQVEEHLESCEECREMFDLCKDSVSSLRSLSKVDPPRDLEQKIKKRIRARSRGKFFSATSDQHVVHRVPFEFISLILILIAMALFYMMTLVAGMEAHEEPPDDGQESGQPEE